jgi:hypothetical protein
LRRAVKTVKPRGLSPRYFTVLLRSIRRLLFVVVLLVGGLTAVVGFVLLLSAFLPEPNGTESSE